MTHLAGEGGVTYDRHGWILEGRRPFLYSGEIHYFRVPPDQWTDRLFKARQAFLNAIGAYMAWNWHEPRPGEMDFSGDRDLDRWLRLIEEQGLYIIARPGPYICSEWDFGGFPGWLAAAPRMMRSLDPAYMEPCTRWLEAVDRIIAPHQLGQGGRVILYQIENEYFWGDLPYHLRLKQLAEEHGITVPIVTNENKATRGSPIIETPDPYPRHVWDVLFPEHAVRELREMQPDKPPFGMEVQGGFFSMTGAPFTAYSRFAGGSIDPGWTDVYIKTLIAAGLNGVNYYMFHGGTNFGRFAGKYMTTTYDFDAAVREWGELSDRYYVIRRLGGFLASLGEALVSTDPVASSGQPMDLGVQVLARQGNGVAFLFPRNLHACALETPLSFQHPLTGQTRTIPRRGMYVAAPYSMGLLPIAIPLRAGLTLEHTTSQVFHLSDGDETTLVLWEREGFAGELLLSGPPAAAASWAGPVEAAVEPDGLLLTYRHTHQPQLARVSWPGQRPLHLLIVDAVTAGRTWLPERQGQITPLPSSIYLLRGAQGDGDEWTLDVELRAGEPVALAIPCATPPRLATLDDQPARTIAHEEPGLAHLAFDAPIAPR